MVARAGIQSEEPGASLGHQVFTTDCSFHSALSWLNLSQAPFLITDPLHLLAPTLSKHNTRWNVPQPPSTSENGPQQDKSCQSPLIVSPSLSSFLSKDPIYGCLPYSEGLHYKRKPFFCLMLRWLQISAIRVSFLLQPFLLNKASPYQSLDLFLFNTRFLNPSFIFCKGKKKEKNGLSGAFPVCDLWRPKFSWSISNFKRKRYAHFPELDQVIVNSINVHDWSTFLTIAWKCFSAIQCEF